MDYGDTNYQKYDSKFKVDFTKKLESTQYSGTLPVTGAWRGTNTDRLYEELRWEIRTIEGGIDACVTFTNFGMIRDWITYILKYYRNVPSLQLA